MYYGYECKNSAQNWQGSAGCWGVLSIYNTQKEVIAINYDMTDSYAGASVVSCLVKELRAKDKTLSQVDAQGIVFKELCETILRNRVQWKVEYRELSGRSMRWILRVENFGEMSKNHLMYLLFSIRSCLAGRHNHIFKELRDRGVKSNRKIILGCQLVCENSGMNGLSYLSQVPVGGRIFLSNYTCLADIVTMYRGTSLKGPKDEKWSNGGGYSSGLSGRCVQVAGCSRVLGKDARASILNYSAYDNGAGARLRVLTTAEAFEINANANPGKTLGLIAAFLKSMK